GGERIAKKQARFIALKPVHLEQDFALGPSDGVEHGGIHLTTVPEEANAIAVDVEKNACSRWLVAGRFWLAWRPGCRAVARSNVFHECHASFPAACGPSRSTHRPIGRVLPFAMGSHAWLARR